MLEYQLSSFFKTRSRNLLPGTTFAEEGILVGLTRVDGQLVAGPSTGEAKEVFGGFSISVNVPAHAAPKVEEIVIPSNGIVNLARLPIAGQLFVSIEGTPFAIAAGTAAPADAGSVVQDGQTLYFHQDDAAAMGYAQYHYELTASEASEVTGDYYGGAANTAANVMNVVGCVIEGTIATSMFDASKDWSSIVNPVMGADGRLTTSGPGTVLSQVRVLAAPSSDKPYLVVEVGA